MSSTSRGYFVQAGDSWMKTTVVMIPNKKPLPDVRPDYLNLRKLKNRMLVTMFLRPRKKIAMKMRRDRTSALQRRSFLQCLEEMSKKQQWKDGRSFVGGTSCSLGGFAGKTPPDQVHASYTTGVGTPGGVACGDCGIACRDDDTRKENSMSTSTSTS